MGLYPALLLCQVPAQTTGAPTGPGRDEARAGISVLTAAVATGQGCPMKPHSGPPNRAVDGSGRPGSWNGPSVVAPQGLRPAVLPGASGAVSSCSVPPRGPSHLSPLRATLALPQGAQVWSPWCSGPGSASSPVKSTFPAKGHTEEAEGPSWPVVCRACPGTRCGQERWTWPQHHFTRPGVGLRVQTGSREPWWWAPGRRTRGRALTCRSPYRASGSAGLGGDPLESSTSGGDPCPAPRVGPGGGPAKTPCGSRPQMQGLRRGPEEAARPAGGAAGPAPVAALPGPRGGAVGAAVTAQEGGAPGAGQAVAGTPSPQH